MNRITTLFRESPIPFLLLLLFAGSIFWINFHSAFWYDMDMALNAHLAKLMWNEKTFFPENWVFGNSYSIIESSNLAALFYGLTHRTTLALSMASSLWVLILAGTFIWCLKPFAPRNAIAIGTLCLAGGIIFGTSAASYTKGLQVLYTMASYYACYLEVLLLSLGGWLRVYSGRRLHGALWVLILLLNFAVGMHSLREMLVLGIPLSALSVLLIMLHKQQSVGVRRATVLALFILMAEGAGYLLIKHLDIPASGNIDPVRLEWDMEVLFANFINVCKSLLRISGLAFIKDGVKYLPLFFCALGIAVCVILAIVRILRKKDVSFLPLFILFATISVLAVSGVGIFLFPTRDIYYFIYWLLATLSIVYLIANSEGRRKTWLTGAVCLIAAVNYGYNFLPDFIDYHRYAPQMAETTQRLIDEGYTTLYGDDCAVFAAASKDRIVATPIRINFDSENDCPLSIFPYNKDVSLYDEAHRRQALVCLSNYYLDRNEDVSRQLRASFDLAESFHWRDRTIILCTAKKGTHLFFFE